MTLTGIYTSNATPEEEAAFLTERHCLVDLIDGLKTPCPCGKSSNPWIIDSVVQVR